MTATPTRRHFLTQLAALGAANLLPGVSPTALIIRHGRVYLDGRLQEMDLGITPEGRIQVSPRGLGEARVLDARGGVVAPGFIDILADNRHGGMEVFERYKLSDGVTSALLLHGGASDVAGYHRSRDGMPHWVNHGVAAKMADIRPAHPDVPSRLRQARSCLAAGALALSYSIEYAPAPYEELLAYARLAAEFDRPFFLHLRHSARETELTGVDEAIRLAREGRARIHIDHLHSTGGTHAMPEALARIRKARAEGLEVTCCVYPYGSWATYLASQRFAPGWQKRFGLDYGDLEVVGTGERLTSRTFEAYRRRPEILVAVPERTMRLEKTVDLALQEDFCLVGSDGGIEREGGANNHHRGAGAFATVLRRTQDLGWPLERILAILGDRPRNLLRPALEDRGVIRDGAVADLVVFDPAQVRSPASVARPAQHSLGFHAVLVGGRLAYTPGRFLAQAGRPLRHIPR